MRAHVTLFGYPHDVHTSSHEFRSNSGDVRVHAVTRGRLPEEPFATQPSGGGRQALDPRRAWEQAVRTAGGGLLIEVHEQGERLALSSVQGHVGPSHVLVVSPDGQRKWEARGSFTSLSVKGGAHVIVPWDEDTTQQLDNFAKGLEGFSDDIQASILRVLCRPSIEVRLLRVEQRLDARAAGHGTGAARWLTWLRPALTWPWIALYTVLALLLAGALYLWVASRRPETASPDPRLGIAVVKLHKALASHPDPAVVDLYQSDFGALATAKPGKESDALKDPALAYGLVKLVLHQRRENIQAVAGSAGRRSKAKELLRESLEAMPLTVGERAWLAHATCAAFDENRQLDRAGLPPNPRDDSKERVEIPNSNCTRPGTFEELDAFVAGLDQAQRQ